MEGGFPEFFSQDDFVAYLNENLPCYGIVSRVDGFDKRDFFFLKLPEEWQQRTLDLVEAAKNLFKYDKKVNTSVHKLVRSLKEREVIDCPAAEKAVYFACPTDIGLHISIDRYNLGEKVTFQVSRVMTYANQKIGYESMFDKTKYVAEWIALRVELDNKDVPLVSSSHISIAGLGFDGKLQFNAQGKKKNKK